MNNIVGVLGYLEIAICMVALCFLVVKRLWKEYWALGSFLAFRVVADVLLNFLHAESRLFGLRTAYQLYFRVYWIAFAVEAILAIFMLYAVIRNTAGPLKGLWRLGSFTIVVAAVVLGALALNAAFDSRITPGLQTLVASISRLHRAQSILSCCVLLIVLFAMRPLGLSWRSRAFGVSLGLGLLAANDLVQSWWLTFHPYMGITNRLVNTALVCAVLAIWTAYLASREPERREISIPATSPSMRLNRFGIEFPGR